MYVYVHVCSYLSVPVCGCFCSCGRAHKQIRVYIAEQIYRAKSTKLFHVRLYICTYIYTTNRISELGGPKIGYVYTYINTHVRVYICVYLCVSV